MAVTGFHTVPERTSVAIKNLAAKAEGQDITVAAILAALRDRGFGVFMILFALPNAVIPGLSFILGAPVLLFALQLALGRDEVWLPNVMRKRSLSAPLFARMANRVVRFLVWMEQRTRPRWLWLVSPVAERTLAIYIFAVTVFLMLPVPFGNALPALGISLMAVGLIEKDGKAAALGIVLGFLGCLYISVALVVGAGVIKALVGLV